MATRSFGRAHSALFPVSDLAGTVHARLSRWSRSACFLASGQTVIWCTNLQETSQAYKSGRDTSPSRVLRIGGKHLEPGGMPVRGDRFDPASPGFVPRPRVQGRASLTPWRRSTSHTASVPPTLSGSFAPASMRASAVLAYSPVREFQPFSEPWMAQPSGVPR